MSATKKRITKAELRGDGLRIAREYRRAADRVEAAARSADPLSALDAMGVGSVRRPALRLIEVKNRRDRRRKIGRYAPRKAVRS
ncbi:hypothetical protein [Anaeromyxobacter terrae]|uniref:hypothetical protein n=1 Tax=Anaeromyxobacter terrae TaxID=2925406 RepID=UPI001F591916|nr:hypothetical protein [Anaeromyxobacter sp. SG22]